MLTILLINQEQRDEIKKRFRARCHLPYQVVFRILEQADQQGIVPDICTESKCTPDEVYTYLMWTAM